MEKRLKTISWIGAIFTITGTILNAFQIIWCWPIWIAGNFLWIYWAYYKREWAQFALFMTFQLSNVFGWYKWFII